MKSKPLFFLGIAILAIIILTYFISVERTTSTTITTTPILGILIFHSPIVLIIYLAIAIFLLYKGLGKKISFV